MTTPDTQPGPDTPRVLLLGHAGSGKSSLLGALLRAGEEQGELLRAEVIDPAHNLDAVRDHLYFNKPLAAPRKPLDTHLVRLVPWWKGTEPDFDAFNVVLLDCDGSEAQNLFEKPDPFTNPGGGTLASEVVQADAIVLAVNAKADEEEFEAAFEDFDTFLTVIGRAKIDAREIGGFPVYLVLTRCDTLAAPGDTPETWQEKIDARMEEAQEHLHQFLGDEADEDGVRSPFLPFGKVEVSVSAVAVRRPVLKGDDKPANLPVGVAPLFRNCFLAAKSHRDRTVASNRRLKWTVRAALTMVVMMLAGLGTMLLFPPQPTDTDLEERVQNYVRLKPDAATRLADANLARTKRVLTAFQKDAAFGGLPAELQTIVERDLKEIDDYTAYRDKLAATLAPASARGLEELGRIETFLTNDLPLPPDYSWGDTQAARLRGKWLADIPLIRDAEKQWHDTFREFVRRATVLTLEASFDGNWRGNVDTVFAAAGKLPLDPSATIPGSPVEPQPRGEALTYRVPFEFDRVYQARRDWDLARDRLTHLRDLADALNMTGGANRPEPLLTIPEPGPPFDAGARLAALRKAFPRPSENFAEWELRNFPEPGRSELQRRVQRAFSHGARHVQTLVRTAMGQPPEARDTVEGWRAVADSLKDPAFVEWGKLLHLLARLQDPKAANPIDEFAAFLRAESFALDPRGFELAIPVDLREQRVVPNGPLTITLTPRGGPPETRTLNVRGEGVRQGATVVYTLAADADVRLTYRPGELLTAELPVRAGMQDLKLVWGPGGTDVFQFERLLREPKLVRGGSSEPAAGVRLTPTAGTVVPPLPPLLPEVRR
jgi:hypothetical protein